MHRLEKIRTDTRQLNSEDWKHIENCPICKNEYNLMKQIENSIENLPEISVPVNIESLIEKIFYRPIYTIYQLAGIGLLVIFLPFIFQYRFFLLWLNQSLIIFLTLLSVSIYMVILIILSFHVWILFPQKVEFFSRKFDIFLEKKLMKIEK